MLIRFVTAVWILLYGAQAVGRVYIHQEPALIYIPIYIFLPSRIYICILFSCVIFLDTPIKLSICLGAPLFTLTDFACCLRCARCYSPRCCLLCVYELHYICRSLNARRDVALFIEKGEPGNRQVIIQTPRNLLFSPIIFFFFTMRSSAAPAVHATPSAGK